MEIDSAALRQPSVRPRRWWLRLLAAAVVLVAIFGFALPRLADYGAAWDSVVAMTKWKVMTVAAFGAWNLLVMVATLVLRAERSTERAGHALDRLLVRLRGSERASGVTVVTPWLLEARGGLVLLARRAGLRLVAVTLVSHLSLYLVLLVTLRSVGVSDSDVSWSSVFATFAFVRLLSAVPVTPGGLGVVELGYVGFLSSEAPNHLDPAISAGVLVFRAVTFLLPLILGAMAWIAFQTATSWRRPPDTRGHAADG